MADMGRFKVDLQRLGETFDEMGRFDTSVEDTLTELDRHIADLHASWLGTAAAAQRDAHDRWVRGVAEMREGLGKLRDAAKAARGNHGDAVEVNVRMWP